MNNVYEQSFYSHSHLPPDKLECFSMANIVALSKLQLRFLLVGITLAYFVVLLMKLHYDMATTTLA